MNLHPRHENGRPLREQGHRHAPGTAYPGSGSGRVDVGGYVSLPAASIQRSIKFYRRVFAFRIQEDVHNGPYPYVVMHAAGKVHLAIHAHSDATAPPVQRFSLVVGDLDRVRADLWDLGVPVAEDNGEPDHRYPWRPSRSLLLHDPDGHEIELVETRSVSWLRSVP